MKMQARRPAAAHCPLSRTWERRGGGHGGPRGRGGAGRRGRQRAARARARPLPLTLPPPSAQPRRGLTVRAAKADIHPKWYDEATVMCNGEVVLVTSGTQPKYTGAWTWAGGSGRAVRRGCCGVAWVSGWGVYTHTHTHKRALPAATRSTPSPPAHTHPNTLARSRSRPVERQPPLLPGDGRLGGD